MLTYVCMHGTREAHAVTSSLNEVTYCLALQHTRQCTCVRPLGCMPCHNILEEPYACWHCGALNLKGIAIV